MKKIQPQSNLPRYGPGVQKTIKAIVGIFSGGILATMLMVTALFLFPLVFVTVGIVTATFVLTAAWATLGPGPFWKRGGYALLAGTIVAAPLPVAFVITVGELTVGLWILLYMISTGPIIWIAAQAPFWIVRIFFGWRIGIDCIDEPAFTISDVMALMALVSIALAGARLSALQGPPGQNMTEMYLVSMLPTMIAVFVTTLLLGLPAINLLLRRKQKIENEPVTSQVPGCGTYAVITIVICMLMVVVISVLASINGAGAGSALGLMIVSGFVLATSFCIGMPLLGLADQGLICYRIQDYNELDKPGAKDSNRDVMVEPVKDPFGDDD